MARRFEMRLTDESVEHIRLIRVEYGLHSDAAAVAFALNQVANDSQWKTELRKFSDRLPVGVSGKIAKASLYDSPGAAAASIKSLKERMHQDCAHPARARVGTKCTDCGGKWQN